MQEAEHVRVVGEEEVLRAKLYALIAQLLARPPNGDDLRAWSRAEAAELRGDETEMGAALRAFADVAQRSRPAAVEDEFAALFIGLTEGELRPYKSYYLTGFLYEKPLADVRRDMEALGVARVGGVPEPEDHIAILCEIMHGLIMGTFAPPADLPSQRTFFRAHLDPWAPDFFHDLETARNAVFYRPVGTIGRVFMAIEREAFAMAEEG